MTPVELFGHNRFPRIGELPYLLTLGPHDFYWFTLERGAAAAGGSSGGVGRGGAAAGAAGRRLAGGVPAPGPRRPRGRSRPGAAAARPGSATRRGWSAAWPWSGRSRSPTRLPGSTLAWPWSGWSCNEGEAETYGLPLALAAGEAGEALTSSRPEAVVARVAARGGGEGVLVDAIEVPSFLHALIALFLRRGRVRVGDAALVAAVTPALRRIVGRRRRALPARLVDGAGQSRSIVFGERVVLKLFRRVEAGVHPDLEVGRFLTEVAAFPHTPAVVGALELRPARGAAATVAVLREYVAHECDAWHLTLDALGRFYERLAARPGDGQSPAGRRGPGRSARLGNTADASLADDQRELLGAFPERARAMGERTAEMHLALAGGADPAFVPEPFSTLYQRSLYQSMRSLAGRSLRRLAAELDGLTEPVAGRARRLLESGELLAARFAVLRRERFDAVRMRIHGDLDLTNLLWTGRDFCVVDFEGDPARPVSERRIKRSPLADVAGMIRSFHLAAATAGERHAATGYRPVHPELAAGVGAVDRGRLPRRLPGADGRLAGAARRSTNGWPPARRLPPRPHGGRAGLCRFHRPGWMAVTLEGILDQLEER